MAYCIISVDLSLMPERVLAASWRFPEQTPASGRASRETLGKWIAKADELQEQRRSKQRDLMPVSSSSGSTWEKYAQETGIDICTNLFLTPERNLTCPVNHWNHTFDDPKLPPTRIVFEIANDDAETLCSIPFETMYCNRQGTVHGVFGAFVLGDPISVVRRIKTAPGFQILPLRVFRLPLEVLILAPEPNHSGETWDLDTQGEIASIEEALASLGRKVRWTVVRGSDATFARLNEEAGHCHVVHFIGHGKLEEGEAKLLLTSPSGERDWRRVADIAQCLLGRSVRLVFLNGCRTAAIGAFACCFPAVVGMQFEISDKSAKAFANGFYKTLVESGQLDDAVRNGRIEIFEQSGREKDEYAVPVLYMSSDDGILFRWPRYRKPLLFAAMLCLLVGATALAGRPGFRKALEAMWPARSPAQVTHQTVDERTSLNSESAYCLWVDGEYRHDWFPLHYVLPPGFSDEESRNMIEAKQASAPGRSENCIRIEFNLALLREKRVQYAGFGWTKDSTDRLSKRDDIFADLTGKREVLCDLRADLSGPVWIKALISGQDSHFPGDSEPNPRQMEVKATTEWQTVRLPLDNANLSRVVTPFYVGIEMKDFAGKDTLIVYVDNVRYE